MNETEKQTGESSLDKTVSKINEKADKLEGQGRKMRRWHQWVTVLTILLGVTAPALVTFSATNPRTEWQILAVIITAFASAFATIKSVLRFSERYSNSALTSLALSRLAKKILFKRAEAAFEIDNYEKLQMRFYKIAVEGDDEFYEINKNYVEQEVSTVIQETQKLAEFQKTKNVESQKTENEEVKNIDSKH